jgi:hypothetical protein
LAHLLGPCSARPVAIHHVSQCTILNCPYSFAVPRASRRSNLHSENCTYATHPLRFSLLILFLAKSHLMITGQEHRIKYGLYPAYSALLLLVTGALIPFCVWISTKDIETDNYDDDLGLFIAGLFGGTAIGKSSTIERVTSSANQCPQHLLYMAISRTAHSSSSPCPRRSAERCVMTCSYHFCGLTSATDPSLDDHDHVLLHGLHRPRSVEHHQVLQRE